MNLPACIDDILKRGLGDWIQAAEVSSVARSVGGAKTATEIRELSTKAIRKVVEEGLMTIGDLTQNGFREWDLPPNRALERIEKEWSSLDREPNLGEICWLSNTEQGDRRARQLEDRETVG